MGKLVEKYLNVDYDKGTMVVSVVDVSTGKVVSKETVSINEKCGKSPVEAFESATNESFEKPLPHYSKEQRAKMVEEFRKKYPNRVTLDQED